ncbi:argininosuccinate lyase [Streptomyces sp. NPDC059092]|uniref:argininosuccinate lyase n=1 Tax=Streptomyces sp. NPDC059092 TaxID=3346725 RepID=UPI0036A14781
MLQQSHCTYRGYRTAGIRLTEPLLKDLEFHRTERFGVTLDAIHSFDKAHLVMLVEQGLIGASDGRAMLREIRRMESIGVEEARLQAQGGEHSCEQFLIRSLGEEIGGQLNLARSSGDLGEVSRRITLRTRITTALTTLLTLRRAVIELAERHTDAVFPAQTFLQHAQPTSLGHWFAMWAAVLSRDTDRLLALYERVNESPAGAGILTGSDFAIERHRTAALLGFDAPMANTYDAIMSHDVSVEALSVIGIVWSGLARMSDDIELWFSSDAGFIDVPDRFCDTSSVMPQKRNPGLPQQIKAQSAKALGALTAGYLAERGASGQPMLERLEAERSLWELYDDLAPLTHNLGLMLTALTPRTERMLDAAAASWSTASDLAALLVREAGLPWRSAHQITGIVVRLSTERKIPPNEVGQELVDEAAGLYFGKKLPLDPAALADALDPVASVARRTVYGGPAPAAVVAACEETRAKLDDDGERVRRRSDRVGRAALDLESAIDTIIAAA